ncbi:response regulator [Nitrogeniibacter mangrovi]|uniref:Response regulator n=1 Tax=Nitrogeniibacter mangrovi TaxID=2016596 RepID=A0A6C1B8H0_9RHOO|nr:response regulator [Nitrogeniibacter mangrovi]QID19018.1 response regulator [Nitrogeniibacter mangrovi]
MMPHPTALRARILAVDEEPFSLELVSEVLGEAYEVTALQDGRAALRLLDDARCEFDLVILDRRMQAPDGMAILRHIRASPTLAHLPVILQTAVADPVQVAEGIEAGADFYLTKPFRIEALSAMVRAALRQSRERVQLAEQAADMETSLALLGQGVFRFRTVDEAAALARAVARLCAEPDLVRIALAELLVNAVEHGNLGLGFEAKQQLMQSGCWREEIDRRQGAAAFRHRVAQLAVSVEADAVRFVIEDQGEGFDWTRFQEMPDDPVRLNGRGIALARQLAFPALVFADGGRRIEAEATPRPRFRA